jgi:hypothetical protein
MLAERVHARIEEQPPPTPPITTATLSMLTLQLGCAARKAPVLHVKNMLPRTARGLP